MVMSIAKEIPSQTLAELQRATPTYDALDLTQGNGLAHIQLAEQVYTLRITRAGKLILTK